MPLNISKYTGALQLAFVVGIIGFAVVLSASLAPEPSGVRAAAVSDRIAVSTVVPDTTEYRPNVSLNGVVEARSQTSVIPQVSGRIVSVSDGFRPGATLSAGDELFVIDPVDYELSVERTLAEIEAARSELALLEAESDAERRVWQSQSPDRPIPDLIARVPQIAAAKARIRSAQAARRAAELSLERTVVRAPFDARVLTTQLDVGQVVSTGVSVGSLYAIDGLEIAVPASAGDIRRIGRLEGRAVETRSAAGQLLQGEIVRASAALDASTRTRLLYVDVDQPEALTVGEFFSVVVEGAPVPDALRLPTSALTSRNQVWIVEDGLLQQRSVDVVGTYGNETLVRTFDSADGVVSLPPPGGFVGMEVNPTQTSSLVRKEQPARDVN